MNDAHSTVKLLRSHYKDLKEHIDYFTPTGREQSLALTNLEQSMLWAIESINEEADK